MQSLNVTKLTPEQLGWLGKIWLFKRNKWHIDENYPYSMPTWLIILITVLGTLIIGAGILIFPYCKHKNAPTCLYLALSISSCKENFKKTKPMLENCPQQSMDCPKIKQPLKQWRKH